MDEAYQKIRDQGGSRLDKFLFINPIWNENEITRKFKYILEESEFSVVANRLFSRLNSYRRSNQYKRDFIISFIIFVGKIYQFSQFMILDSLPAIEQIKNNRDIDNGLKEQYMYCFARIAINSNLQKTYFSSFESLYTYKDYLWGYGRILRWYYDFTSSQQWLKYKQHSIMLMEYLLNRNPNQFDSGYTQNAFLALIYLLTFRAYDKQFFQSDSTELSLARSVISHYLGKRIILNQVSQDKSLNQYFQELLEGSASDKDIVSLLEAR